MTVIVTSSLLSLQFNVAAAAQSESFSSFVNSIAGAFVAAGWVDTNAFGSINLSQITPPGVDVRSVGYQVFRMNDALHNAGYPVYIRVDYGSPTPSNIRAGLPITVGFTHDGSGSVGGSNIASGYNNTGNTNMHISVGQVATSGSLYDHRICIISGGDMGIIIGNNFTGEATFGFVERTKDSNGNPTTDGVIVGTFVASNNTFRQSYLMYNETGSVQAPNPETAANVVLSGLAASAADNNLSAGMIIPMVSYGPHNPLRMVGFTKSSDMTGNTTHALDIYSTSSIYFVSSNTAFSTYQLLSDQNIISNHRLIMRSE